MVCIRSTSLLLGLLLTLVAIGESIAFAHQAIGGLANHNHVIEAHKELQVEAGATAATRSKWLRGRKMGVEDVVKKEIKGRMNTGKAVNSFNRPFGSSNTDEKILEDRSTTLKPMPPTTHNLKTNGSGLGPVNLPNSLPLNSPSAEVSPTHGSLVSHGSHEQFQTTETQKLLAATTELYNMLSKDYQTKARKRPPINNHLPLEDSDVEEP